MKVLVTILYFSIWLYVVIIITSYSENFIEGILFFIFALWLGWGLFIQTIAMDWDENQDKNKYEKNP